MKNTTLCYIEQDGKYLMIHRVKKVLDENKDKWIGIGGKFEGEETPDECLLREAKEETGLTLSAGVSFNKIFAKLGSDYKKPDATTVISRENWTDIVRPLPVSDLLFVGHSVQKTLHAHGIETIGQLADCREDVLETLLGKMGRQLHIYANGLDREPVRSVNDREPIKSVGNGNTFRVQATSDCTIRINFTPKDSSCKHTNTATDNGNFRHRVKVIVLHKHHIHPKASQDS